MGRVSTLDTETRNHDIRVTRAGMETRVMKNVTITLPAEVVTEARVAAARRGQSLSKFVSELVEREVGAGAATQLKTLEEFFSGPGIPGISKNWRGREELYAERENKLLRRHKHSDLRSGPVRTGKAAHGGGFAEADDRKPHAGAKRPKSQ
jgi:hypothetical protein